ncbi:hypothetical protein GGI43DRAFT_204267 [Trichoderma evansii]
MRGGNNVVQWLFGYARSTLAYLHVLSSRERAFRMSRSELAISSRNLTASTATAHARTHARTHAHAGNTALMADGSRPTECRPPPGFWRVADGDPALRLFSRGRTRATTPETGGVFLPRGWG